MTSRIAISALIKGAVIACIALTTQAALPGVGAAYSQEREQVRTGGQYPPIFEYVYRHYAIDGGFMEQQGLDAEFVGFTAGLTGTQALTGGSVQFACDGMSGTLSAAEQGGGSKIVYIANADNTYVIIAREHIEEPADVAGRRWAITQMGAISQTYAALWLQHHGIENVEWVPIGGTAARGRALIADQVDAAMLTIGEWLKIQEEPGIHLIEYLADVVPPLPLSACSASATLIEEQPDLVQRYVNANLNAIRHARSGEEGYAGYIAAAKEHGGEDVTEEQYAEMAKVYLGPEGNMFAIDPNGGMYPEVLRSNMESMIQEGSLTRMMDLNDIWDPTFVNNYIAEHGWYDVTTQTDGNYLRDLLRK